MFLVSLDNQAHKSICGKNPCKASLLQFPPWEEMYPWGVRLRRRSGVSIRCSAQRVAQLAVLRVLSRIHQDALRVLD